MKPDAKSTIEAGKAILGIEFGSTRIKAVLIDQENKPIAQGSHTWENQLVDGLWTYSVEAIWYGLQDCYADLRSNVKSLYDIEIETLAAIGVSAMMHGYMAFNDKEEILVPFRTWRNTNTGAAAAALSELFVYNIPLRWSISHLYPGQRRTCERYRLSDNTCRFYPLADNRSKSIGHRRCIGYAPYRSGYQELLR
jgi:sugar (pentulose or hexulose) kinase